MTEIAPNRLKQIREAAEPKIELYDVAHHLRVSVDTVRRWDENKGGPIPSKHIPKLAAFLKVSEAHVMGWDRQSTETPRAAA